MKKIFQNLLQQIDFPEPYKITFWDGDEYRHGEGDPLFTLRFRTEDALQDMLVRGSLGFGESYMSEEIDVDGDLQHVVHLGTSMIRQDILQPTLTERIRVAWNFYRRRNTLEGSRKNISAHYDLGNDFYSIWLDEEMQYTCAYFESPGESIEHAQQQKMDLVCRKLRLQPGDTVVEAGCGWGHFAIYAAQNYGVHMRSYNISKEQIEHARSRAKFLGLGPDQVEFIHDDYRTIADENRKYDAFVSIGMLEHVGRENYSTLYDIIHKTTKESARSLVHTIGFIAPAPTDPWIEKHIFPGGYIPSLSEIVTPLEKINRPLHVVDVENLRYHYALTLDQWSNRFEENVKQIRQKYGEAFVRKFRLYLRASASGFRYNGLQLFQVLLSNGYNNDAPLTRHHFHGLETGMYPALAGAGYSSSAAGHNGNGHNGNNGKGQKVTRTKSVENGHNGKKGFPVTGTRRSRSS